MSFFGTYASPVPGIVLSCTLEDKFWMPNVTIQQFPFVCQTFIVLFIMYCFILESVPYSTACGKTLNSLCFSHMAVSYLILQHPYFLHNAVSYSTFIFS